MAVAPTVTSYQYSSDSSVDVESKPPPAALRGAAHEQSDTLDPDRVTCSAATESDERIQQVVSEVLGFEIQTLVEALRDGKRVSSRDLQEAVTDAAKRGDLQLLRFLFPYAKELDFEVPLREACVFGHLAVIEFLLDNCIILILSDAVRQASLHGQVEALQLLAESGEGIDPWDAAWVFQELVSGVQKEMVSFWLTSGYPIAEFGLIHAIELAADRGDIALIVEILKNREIESEIVGMRVVQYAEAGYLDVVRALVDHCTISKKDQILAMDLASNRGHFAVVQYLYLVDHTISQWVVDDLVRNGLPNGGNYEMTLARALICQKALCLQEEVLDELDLHKIKRVIPKRHQRVLFALDLWIACSDQDEEAVLALLEKPEAISFFVIREAVRRAAMQGKYRLVFRFEERLLVDEDEDFDVVRGTAILSAAANGQTECVRQLFDHLLIGCNTYNGAIAAAAEMGFTETVRFLLQQDRYADDRRVGRSMGLAAENGHSEVLELLVTYKENNASCYGLRDALALAAKRGHLQCLKVLKSAFSNSALNYSRALYHASAEEHLDIIEFLLSSDHLIAKGWSLSRAAQNGKRAAVELILGSGREISQKALAESVQNAAGAGELEIVQLLLSGDRMIKREELAVALNLSVQEGHLKVVRYLFAIAHLSTDKWLAAVKMAARGGWIQCVEFLLTKQPAELPNLEEAVEAAAAAGSLKLVELLLSKSKRVSLESYRNCYYSACTLGDLPLLDYFTPMVEAPSMWMIREEGGRLASEEGHLPVVQRIAVHEKIGINVGNRVVVAAANEVVNVRVLDSWLVAAASQGQLEIVKFLLSDGPTLSQDCFSRVIESAASSGNVELLEYVYNLVRTVPCESHEGAVIAAVHRGHLDAINFLCARQAISGSTCAKAVYTALKEKRRRIASQLLRWQPLIPADLLGQMVLGMCELLFYQCEAVEMLLADDRTISREDLERAVKKAIENHQSALVAFLLSEERTISSDCLNECVDRALSLGDRRILTTLIANGELSTSMRGRVALHAASGGYADLLEAVLRSGPIYESALASARTHASTDVRDILDSAPTLPNLGFRQSRPSASGFSVTLEDVEKQPLAHLERLAESGVPRRVELLNNPEAIDLGGITKQYLTTLSAALVAKGFIKLNSEGMPFAEQSHETHALLNMGRLYSHLEKRNSTRIDRFLVGELFCERFYRLIHLVANQAEKSRLVEVAGEGTPYAEASDYLAPQLLAVRNFYEGLFDETKLLFKAKENLREHFQGVACSKEALLEAILFDGIGMRADWLGEMIADSSLEWRQQFLFALTGNRTLVAGLKLKVRMGWRSVFELHTCFNSLDLPPIALSKEDFIEGVNAAISSADYNTA
ncbi:MAG: hypothetical protein S4CHLAM81_03740 [Chlamydiales bacterium]|nr:hypothetical protein [Chlamydiales bacterium]MCH9635163.1 hypothetical protein [Chlamydiales bacterium]MCH9703742.1 ankyrin repeat domain-containing protein [Chlamydiota bacterium]